MKQFIKYILVFLFLVSITNGSIILVQFFREKEHYEKDMTIEGNESVIVCSDSQTEVSLNPALFPELFNASKSGQLFCYTVAKTMDCLRINTGNVRIVLIPVHFNRIDNGGFSKKLPYVHHQLIIPVLHGEVVYPSELVTSLLARWKNSESGYGKFFVHEKCGFESYPEKMKTYISNMVHKANSNECWNDFESSDFIQRLNSFIEAVKAENCVPVILSTPLHRDLRDGFVHWDEFNAVITAVTNQHRCLWLNYVDMPFADAEFADANHLNFKGAERFTKQVRSDLLLHGILK